MRAVKISEYQYIEESNSELYKLNEKIQEVAQQVNDRITEVLAECVAECGSTLDELISQRLDKLSTVQECVDDVCMSLQDYYESRSEKWQGSDNGETYNQWREVWMEAQDQLANSCVEVDVFNHINTDGCNDAFGLEIEITPNDIELPPRTPDEM